VVGGHVLRLGAAHAGRPPPTLASLQQRCADAVQTQVHGPARTMTVSVPTSQIPVSKKQQIRSEFGSRTFGGDDDGVEPKTKMPDKSCCLHR
jgi:hypothetical protein